MAKSRVVPMESLRYRENSILADHLGTTDYLLAPRRSGRSAGPVSSYDTNEAFWRDVMSQEVSAGMKIRLRRFHLMDWFPRSPGLYHTQQAERARRNALGHLHPGLTGSPIRDHAARAGKQRASDDYTIVLTPSGKQSMLDGGIGAIRLKPINTFGEPHWLVTATSNGVTHAGVPLAVPRGLYAPLLAAIQKRGAVCVTIHGDLEFIPDPFSRLFDRAVMVPRLLLKVSDIAECEPKAVSLETSVAASFVSEYKGRPEVYASYVTFPTGVKGALEEAAAWMKTEYVEGEYGGRIITDFDQTRTIFPDARMALSKVMDRAISRGELRETVELMHASGSVEQYFDEITRRDLLPGAHRGKRDAVFISYAHAAEDETGWVGRVRTHLEGLRHSSGFVLEVWDDTKIDPGERWRKKIEAAINRTRVAILVLTAEFLASPFIRSAELPLLLEAAEADGATILCLYGSSVHLSGHASRLEQYQFVNKPGRPLQRLSKAAREEIYTKLAVSVEKALTPKR